MTAVYTYLKRHFHTNFIIYEAAEIQKALVFNDMENIEYFFVQDNAPFFHHTYYRNILIRKAKTQIVGVWDVDILASTKSIINAVEKIRIQQAVMTWPYDGICYNLSREASRYFISTLDINKI